MNIWMTVLGLINTSHILSSMQGCCGATVVASRGIHAKLESRITVDSIKSLFVNVLAAGGLRSFHGERVSASW